MANRYLEKIAGMGNTMYSGGRELVHSLGRVAVAGVKATGRQLYKATGGTFIDHGIKVGIKDPYKLSGINGSREGLRKLRNAHIADQFQGKKPDVKQLKRALGKFNKETIPQLKRDQLDARITSGAIVGGAGYGVHKVREKLNESSPQTYSNYY